MNVLKLIIPILFLVILGTKTAYSQNTIQITENQADQIIKDKRELIALKSVVSNWESLISTQKAKISALEELNRENRILIDLHSENYSDCLKRVSIIEDKKSPLIIDILKGLGLVAVGFIVGSI